MNRMQEGVLFKGTNHLSFLFFQDLNQYYPIRSPMYIKTFSSSYIFGKQTKKGKINSMWASQVGKLVNNLPVKSEDTRDVSLIPG